MPESKTLVRGGLWDHLSQTPRGSLWATKSSPPAVALTGKTSRPAPPTLRRPNRPISSAWEASQACSDRWHHRGAGGSLIGDREAVPLWAAPVLWSAWCNASWADQFSWRPQHAFIGAAGRCAAASLWMWVGWLIDSAELLQLLGRYRAPCAAQQLVLWRRSRHS